MDECVVSNSSSDLRWILSVLLELLNTHKNRSIVQIVIQAPNLVHMCFDMVIITTSMAAVIALARVIHV